MSDHKNTLAIKLIKEAKEAGQNYLDLSELGLWELPIEIETLNGLVYLNISNNNISSLPPEINSLKSLRTLDISNNNFRHLEFDYTQLTGLVEINLTSNDFEHIPECCLSLPFIDNIEIEDNPLIKRVPPEIRSDGFWAVADFLFNTKKLSETRRMFAAKLLLVGNGEVGKTSLLKKLLHRKFKLELGKEQTTHGINIKKWILECKFEAIEPYYSEYEDRFYSFEERDSDEKPEGVDLEEYLRVTNEMTGLYIHRQVNLNVWDFGGQAIYHSTHQFFLTARSVYLLIWDPRKNEYQISLEYWLNTIKQLGKSSPVIVIMNKSDIRIENIDEVYFRKKFPNIHSFIKVSCLKSYGVNELRDEIKEVVSHLPHIGDRLPKSWIFVKDDLISRSKENYITEEEYFSVCKHYQLPPLRAQFLSNYLHDLGIILHFKNDKLLSNIVILNPEWVTGAVYALLDTRQIQISNGRFEFSDLDKYWNREIYPIGKHHELVRLMEKFEICFNVLGTSAYIIPALLPISFVNDNEPNRPNLQVKYQYNFMPSGVLTRLICRVYNLLQPKKYSKTRVKLKYESTEAVILNNHQEQELKISLFGEEASELLGILKNHIKQIHESLNLKEDIDFHEGIACNCDECAQSNTPNFFKIALLKKYKSKNKSAIECHNSASSVDIRSLTLGYSNRNPNQNLLNSLILAASQLQGIALKMGKDEDTRNSYITNILSARGIIAKDQSRYGRSPVGKNLGELDIKVEDPNGHAISIFEGFNLRNLNRTIIRAHLKKIFDYDPNGLKRNFIMVYSEALNFDKLWKSYMEFIPLIEFKHKLFSSIEDKSSDYGLGTGLRIGRTIHMRDGKRTELFHLFINLTV